MRKLVFFILTALAVGVSGCAENEGGVVSVQIIPAIRTRVTGLHFDSGDRIGLTITRASGTYAENAPMTFDGTTFSAPGLVWYDGETETSTLTAYHPYSESGAPAEFSVAQDQSGGCASSDLLGAVKSGVVPGSAPVGMLFYHLMAQVSVIVTNNSGVAVSGVTIGGFVPTAQVDFVNLSAAAKSGVAAEEVKACEVTAGACYRAILVPQQAQLTVTVTTSDGKSHGKTIPATLASGLSYDLAVEITKETISVNLSGEISDWGSGGSLGGDDSGNDGSTEDDSGTLTYGGATYRTQTVGGRVWMAENMRYMPADAVLGTGVWNPSGGAEAVPTQGLLYDYATASAGTVVASTGTVRGICPEGWHIPDAAELASLAGADYGTDFLCCAGFMIVRTGTENKYETARGYLMGATLPVENKCNCLKFTTDGLDAQVSELSVDYGLTLRCVKDVN